MRTCRDPIRTFGPEQFDKAVSMSLTRLEWTASRQVMAFIIADRVLTCQFNPCHEQFSPVIRRMSGEPRRTLTAKLEKGSLPMCKGRLFVISAPSGAGKSTLIERIRVMFPDLVYSISCTTRTPRFYENEGVDYYFMDKREFERLADSGGLLEWKEVHGNLYGTPAAPVTAALEQGSNMLLDLDVEGAQEVFRRVPSSVGIFITAPDLAELERRLRTRGSDSEESIRTRMSNAREELERAPLFTYRIVNDDVDDAVSALSAIITKESLCTGAR